MIIIRITCSVFRFKKHFCAKSPELFTYNVRKGNISEAILFVVKTWDIGSHVIRLFSPIA